METIAIASLKGGTGKTTSAAYLAHAYQQLGRRVVIVDADPQGSILDWAETADWSIPTVGLPSAQLHKRLAGILDGRYDVVIIDTPPWTPGATDKGREPLTSGIVFSALRAADTVVIPLAPTMMELRRVTATLKAIDDVAPLREHDPRVRALLNRTKANASSTKVIRSALESHGCAVLGAEIPSREPVAQSFGDRLPSNLYGYLSAAMELEKNK
jgi:chromosome partitioning protein